MTNYNKSFIQIITQKQESFNLFKKNLKGVSLALEDKDTAKATGLLEIYKTGDSIMGNPETQEMLDQINNPILASFLSNRILEMQAAHIDIANEHPSLVWRDSLVRFRFVSTSPSFG